MGTYNSLYAGIYLEVPEVTTEDHTDYLYDPLNNQEFKDKGGLIYSPTSGVKLERKTRIKESKTLLSPYEVFENEWEDFFFAPAYTGTSSDGKGKRSTWILNGGAKEFCLPTGDGDEPMNIDLFSVDPEAIVAKFKETYSGVLQAIADAAGEVYVKFGVVYYAH